MFTKQHYVAVAKCIKPVYRQVLEDSVTADKLNIVGNIVENLCKTFSEDNPNFDTVAFATYITE